MRKLIPVLLLFVVAASLLTIRPWDKSSSQSAQLFGNVDIRDVQLAFRTGGRLQEMLVEEGDQVEPGDVLARLDAQPAREALAVAEANLAQTQAQLASVQAGARPQEIAQVQAKVRDAQVAFDNASNDASRQESLMRSQSTSQTALDNARAARDRAAAQLASAEEALALAQAGATREDIAAAQAAVAAASARVEQARTVVSDTRLTAPSSGIILSRVKEPGSLLQMGQTVYALALIGNTTVRAYIDEPRLGRVPAGTPVRIRTDSGNRVYSGQVGFVSPQAEFTPKTVQTPELRTDLVYRLRIVVSDADEHLLQGMPVTVDLPESKASDSDTAGQ